VFETLSPTQGRALATITETLLRHLDNVSDPRAS
jgi:hypothetical protein